MSQQTVTSREIIKLTREKDPNLSLSHYVGDRLRKLKKWGFVDYEMYTDKYFRSEQRRKVHNIKT